MADGLPDAPNLPRVAVERLARATSSDERPSHVSAAASLLMISEHLGAVVKELRQLRGMLAERVKT